MRILLWTDKKNWEFGGSLFCSQIHDCDVSYPCSINLYPIVEDLQVVEKTTVSSWSTEFQQPKMLDIWICVPNENHLSQFIWFQRFCSAVVRICPPPILIQASSLKLPRINMCIYSKTIKVAGKITMKILVKSAFFEVLDSFGAGEPKL